MAEIEQTYRVDYSAKPKLSKPMALLFSSTWTIGTCAFALFPLLLSFVGSYTVDGWVFDLSRYLQDGSILLFALALLGGLLMDYLHTPEKERLQIMVGAKARNCKWMFSLFPFVGLSACILVLIPILSNPSHVKPSGFTLEWYVFGYSIGVALLLKSVVFACV